MKNILIVDDEKPFQVSLSDALSIHAGELNVLTASNGREAIEILNSARIDLLVTDLKMPELDGFGLLSHMSRHFRTIPVIVMTAFGTPDIEERLRTFGISQFVEKPIDFDDLNDKIMNLLSASASGYIHGVTLASFLQLVDMEKKTCTLTIKAGGKEGRLFFINGEPISAETGGLTGEEAAYKIVCWDDAMIEIDGICRTNNKTLTTTLNHILMEGFRLKDELKRNKWEGENKSENTRDDFEEIFDFPSSNINETQTATVKEEKMALESYLQGLKEIKGYKASGIMNYTGEMLVSDTADTNIDLDIVGATFNDIFRSAHEASRKIGLDTCKETVINTPKGVIIMRCSGSTQKVISISSVFWRRTATRP